MILTAAQQNVRREVEIALDDRGVVAPIGHVANECRWAGIINCRVCDQSEAHAAATGKLHGADRKRAVGAHSQRSDIGLASPRERGCRSRGVSRKRIGGVGRHHSDAAFFYDFVDDDETLVVN